MGSAEALNRFERLTAWPMFVLALLSIPLLLAPVILDLSSEVETTIFALDAFIWAAFAVEYGIRLFLAPRKWTFVRTNLIDLAVVALPLLRPLRLARTARMLRMAGLVRAGVMAARAGDALRAVLTKHRLNYAALVAGISLVSGSLLVWELERGAPDANITSLPDAL
jgi:voltage-gated potassium channel